MICNNFLSLYFSVLCHLIVASYGPAGHMGHSILSNKLLTVFCIEISIPSHGLQTFCEEVVYQSLPSHRSARSELNKDGNYRGRSDIYVYLPTLCQLRATFVTTALNYLITQTNEISGPEIISFSGRKVHH
jgi:hypothetical protein